MRPRYQVVSRNLCTCTSRVLALSLSLSVSLSQGLGWFDSNHPSRACSYASLSHTHTHAAAQAALGVRGGFLSPAHLSLLFFFWIQPVFRHSGLMAAGLLFFGHIRTFTLTRCRLSTPRVAHNLVAITLWSHWWRVFSAHLSLFLCLELRLPGSALSTLAGCLTKFGSQPVRLRSPAPARYTAIVNFLWQP